MRQRNLYQLDHRNRAKEAFIHSVLLALVRQYGSSQAGKGCGHDA